MSSDPREHHLYWPDVIGHWPPSLLPTVSLPRRSHFHIVIRGSRRLSVMGTRCIVGLAVVS